MTHARRPAGCFPWLAPWPVSREDGSLTEHFAVIEDPICEGFEGGEQRTVKGWVENQGLAHYNEKNDCMMELISLKQQHMPGPLGGDDRADFEKACYNLDLFRAELVAGAIAVDGDLKKAVIEDDEALLDFSMTWIRERLFGTRRA